jgi:hypothetical protein
VSSSAGSNGILDGKANAQKFDAWQQEVVDLTPYIHKGALSISRVAAKCGLNRDVFYTNPEIRDRLLPGLIARLKSVQLPDVSAAGPPAVIAQSPASPSSTGGVVTRLEEQNEALKAEIVALRKELKRQEAVKCLLSETGRLPW